MWQVRALSPDDSQDTNDVETLLYCERQFGLFGAQLYGLFYGDTLIAILGNGDYKTALTAEQIALALNMYSITPE